MKYGVPLFLLLSTLYAQSIVGSWEMLAPYVRKVDGEKKPLIRHNYQYDGIFASYLWHNGEFQLEGWGYYSVSNNQIKQHFHDYHWVAGTIEFENDTTMIIQWYGDKEKLLFEKLAMDLEY